MNRGIFVIVVALTTITDLFGQKSSNLIGTWVLFKLEIDEQKVKHVSGGNPIDTLFFNGNSFREVTILSPKEGGNHAGTMKGTFRVKNGKLILQKRESVVENEIKFFQDEEFVMQIRKRGLILIRQITIPQGGSTVNRQAWYHYKKVK